MGGESAAGTMETVALASAKRRGVEPDMGWRNTRGDC